ncbi:MAG: hypothetical protein ACI8UO_001491 [Verrucomicrobiales bacterium]|jgi:hypothetical protein
MRNQVRTVLRFAKASPFFDRKDQLALQGIEGIESELKSPSN